MAGPHPAARRAWLSLIVVAAIGAILYVGLPQVAGLDETWGRLSEGDPWWLIAALLFEIASYTGYVVLFRGVFADAEPPIGWRDSYDITMAGVAATRLLATAGLGGIALTGWALSRLGMARHELTRGLTTFYVALYCASPSCPMTWTGVCASCSLVASAQRNGRHGRRRPAPRCRPVYVAPCACCSARTGRCSARWPGGQATLRSCGRASTRSASRPRRRWW